jgi:hypothetical protein
MKVQIDIIVNLITLTMFMMLLLSPFLYEREWIEISNTNIQKKTSNTHSLITDTDIKLL